MSDSTTGKVAVGEIIGYKKPLIPLGKNVKVLIRVNDDIITVLIDYRQLKFIYDKYTAGRKVAVGFYGGEWHIGSPPAPSNEFTPEQNIADIDLLQREMEDIDLLELVMQPAADGQQTASDEVAPAERPVEEAGAEWVPREQRVLIDSMLEEIDEYSDYVRQIEQTVKDNSEELLRSLGLSHLNTIKKKQKQGIEEERMEKGHKAYARYIERLDVLIAQNSEIISNQKDIVSLLKRYSRSCHELNAKLN